MDSDALVHLNVGGVYFTTRRATLEQSQSFFAGALRTHPECCELFVDRDPTHFRHILNWLRGVRSLPEEGAVLRELAWEADYFCMSDMREAIARSVGRLSTAQALLAIRDELAHK